MSIAAGLVLALASAFALNWSLFVQHGVVTGLPVLSLRRPVHSLLLLFANLRWLAGYLVGWVGWGLYILALHFAALSIVQATSAGGIGVLALLVRGRSATSLSRRETLAALAAVGGLALLGLSLIGSVPRSRPVGAIPVAVSVVAIVAAAALAIGIGRRFHVLAFALGAAGGLCYAAGDIATKGTLGGSGLLFVVVLLACHLAGFVAMQLAFQRGAAIPTAGTSTLLTNAVPIVAGIALFGEGLPSGTLGVLRGLGFAAVLAAAVLLARADAGTSPVADAEPGAEPGAERLERDRNGTVSVRSSFPQRTHICVGEPGAPDQERRRA